MLSVPGKDETKDSALSQVTTKYEDALLVHRLDLDTSGLMVFARGASAQRDINRQFQTRQVFKQYEAICLGTMNEAAGCIELPIIKDWVNRPRQRIDFRLGKSSLTQYACAEQLPDQFQYPATRVQLFPHTGRSHQLRIHMRCIGHPIAGCDLYGNREAYDMSERLLLHACKLQFAHPLSGKPFMIGSPAPF